MQLGLMNVKGNDDKDDVVLLIVAILITMMLLLLISNGNRTEWSPIRSVIIRVINKIGRPHSGSPICLITNYLGMTRTVLLNCPIKAEIRAVENQSDLRILL